MTHHQTALIYGTCWFTLVILFSEITPDTRIEEMWCLKTFLLCKQYLRKSKFSEVTVSTYFYFYYFYYITSQSLYSITRRIRISRLTTTPGSTTPTLYEQCVGSLTSHSINIGKDCETGPTVLRPYPRRLESLTICRCHYKGSTFFSVIVKTLSVGPAGA